MMTWRAIAARSYHSGEVMAELFGPHRRVIENTHSFRDRSMTHLEDVCASRHAEEEDAI